MTPLTLSSSKSIYYFVRKAISISILVAFISTSIKAPAYAQELPGQMPWMPKPGVRVSLSPDFIPANLKGITIHPENALMFDFIIQRGDQQLSNEEKQVEYKKLIKYFLASLAVPDEDQWVNLSPYEKNRIIKDDFGKTEMGRDLLAQEYILKQITASLIYPEDSLGKKFWDKVYTQAQAQYGTTNIPVNTFNKVWILPDSASIYEKGNTAFVVNYHLKVMLEEDYLSLEKHSAVGAGLAPAIKGHPQGAPLQKTNTIGSQVVREIVLPALEKEVNEGKNFAPLRQVYSGMILAAWFKRALKDSLLGKIYADKAKVKGVDQDPKSNQAIYQQYLQAYKKGVFNYIKEDMDTLTKQPMPRKYFSGGTQLGDINQFGHKLDPVAGEKAAKGIVDASDKVTVRTAESGQEDATKGLDTAMTTNILDVKQPVQEAFRTRYNDLIRTGVDLAKKGEKDDIYSWVRDVRSAISDFYVNSFQASNYLVDRVIQYRQEKEKWGELVLPTDVQLREIPAFISVQLGTELLRLDLATTDDLKQLGLDVAMTGKNPVIKVGSLITFRDKGLNGQEQYNVSIAGLKDKTTAQDKVVIAYQDGMIRITNLNADIMKSAGDLILQLIGPSKGYKYQEGAPIKVYTYDSSKYISIENVTSVSEADGKLVIETTNGVFHISASEVKFDKAMITRADFIELGKKYFASRSTDEFMRFEKAPVFFWKIPESVSTFIDLPEEVQGWLKNAQDYKPGYPSSDLIAQVKAEGGSIAIQWGVGVVEAYLPKMKVQRNYQPISKDAVFADKPELVSGLKTSKLLDQLIPMAIPKGKDVRLAIRASELGIAGQSIEAPSSWGPGQVQNATLNGNDYIIVSKKVDGSIDFESMYMVNENPGDGRLPINYIPLDEFTKNRVSQTSSNSAMIVPTDIIEASLDEATKRYQATNAKGAETNSNWTKLVFTTDADKKVQSGIVGEWITPTKNDKKKRGVVEVLKGREYIGRDAAGNFYMDLFTVPNAAKTQNLKDMDAVGLQDAVDTIKVLKVEGVNLVGLKTKMSAALVESNSGKLLSEGYDAEVLKAGESMHQLWRGHEQARGGNPDQYGVGGFAKLDQAWLQALDLNFVDIVLNVLDSNGRSKYDEAVKIAKQQPDNAVVASKNDMFTRGGIDFNSANLNLQIKRDGNGVPLPIAQQNLENIHIEGLVPVIIDIRPAASTPQFAQFQNANQTVVAG